MRRWDIKLGDREANFAAVEEWMKKYWTPSETETAVVLPEMFDVGYVIDEAEKYADRGAERAVEFLSGLARRYNVWFAGGSVLAWADGAAVNRALVVNPRGEYVAHYDKAHLVPMMDEDKYLRGGSEFCIFDLSGVKMRARDMLRPALLRVVPHGRARGRAAVFHLRGMAAPGVSSTGARCCARVPSRT